MAISFDYFRAGRPVSPRRAEFPLFRAAMLAGIVLAAALPALAQYPGQVDTTKKNGPDVRAVAVLEWTGKEGDPKASRIVPITVWDGHELQDASIYLARPAPLAVETDVEYKLKQNGKTIGLYDIETAGQVQGMWVGHGAWKPLPSPKPPAPPKEWAASDFGDNDSGPPILHRKKPAGDKGKSSDSSAPPPDSDRPTLHRSDSSGDQASDRNNAPPPDPDRPRLKEAPKDTAAAEPKQNEVAYSQALTTISDPDRPRLVRGKPESSGPSVLPTLVGLPEDMHQTIAVSDASNHPDHEWNYTWANPADQDAMKSDLEDVARKELGLIPPPPPSKPAPRRTAARRKASPPPPPPPALEDEQFRVFQLTYGSSATMVFSAHTQGTGAQEKFITLIAQPDLYGNVSVLLKSVTDAAHLDDKPAMRLIDPVDAMADNRGELLFELRGATQRQFVLYRVLRGQVQKLFTSQPETVVVPLATHPAG